jgi:hypothetical protein
MIATILVLGAITAAVVSSRQAALVDAEQVAARAR